MSAQGLLYIYCIARLGREEPFEVDGLAERRLVEGGLGLRAIRHESIAAVVSEIGTGEPEPSRENTLTHETVVDGIMARYPILPVRFGTVADGACDIEEKLLRRRYGEFLGLLREMTDKVELGLKAFWKDMAFVFGELAREYPALARARERVGGRGRGLTPVETVQVGKLVEAALEEKRDREAEEILERLGDLPEQVRLNRILLEQMVLNAAFLVDRSREPDFDGRVAALDSEFGERLRLKYVGPMAPFNFVNITVHWDE